MKTMIKSLSVAALSFVFTGMLNAQSADDIVAKHIDAIGGKNWEKVKSMRMESKMTTQGAEVILTRTSVDKKAMRMDIMVMGMSGYSIVTNKDGWTYMPFQGQTKAEPMTADDVKNSQDELELKDAFMTFKDQGKKLEYIGTDDMDGTTCHKLKITDKDGMETTYFLDQESYYILKQIQKVKADGKEYETSTSFSNYKKTDEGVVYPMTIGSDWGDMEVTKLEINPKIDESIFKPTN